LKYSWKASMTNSQILVQWNMLVSFTDGGSDDEILDIL